MAASLNNAHCSSLLMMGCVMGYDEIPNGVFIRECRTFFCFFLPGYVDKIRDRMRRYHSTCFLRLFVFGVGHKIKGASRITGKTDVMCGVGCLFTTYNVITLSNTLPSSK